MMTTDLFAGVRDLVLSDANARMNMAREATTFKELYDALEGNTDVLPRNFADVLAVLCSNERELEKARHNLEIRKQELLSILRDYGNEPT